MRCCHALLTSFLVLVVGCQTIATAVAAPDRHEIRIGVIASLSGPAAENGENWKRGAELAADELRAEGSPVRIFIEDDQTTPGMVARAFHKLVQSDRVHGIVGGTWDYLAQTAYPLAAQYKIPFITPTNPVELFQKGERENPYVFTNAFRITSVAPRLASLLAAEGVRRLAIVAADIPWGHAHATMAREVAAKLGIEVIYDTSFPLEGYPQNLRAIALRLASLKPDGVLVTFDYNGIDRITAEFARLHLDPLIIDTQHLRTAFEFSKDPARYENLFGMYPLVRDERFEERFLRRFGSRPEVFAAEGYDAMRFLVGGLQKFDTLSRRSGPFVWRGLLGDYTLPSSSGALADPEIAIMTTRGGKFQRYEPPAMQGLR